MKATFSKDCPVLSTLPVANVIGALFERRGSASEKASEVVPNPFRKFLLSALGGGGSSAQKEGSAPQTAAVASRADSYIGDSGGEDRADDMSLDSPGVDRAMGGTIRSDVGTLASVSGLSSDPGTPSLAPASVAGGSETMSQGEDRDLDDEIPTLRYKRR